MKSLVVILFSLFSISFPQEKEKDQLGTLTVRVTNVSEDKGKVRLTIYNSETSFLKKNFRDVVKPATKGTMVFVVRDLPRKAYAVMVHHDQNENDEVDTYFFGLPKEPYGFSNDARSAFGPPAFESAKILLDKAEMTINFQLQ